VSPRSTLPPAFKVWVNFDNLAADQRPQIDLPASLGLPVNGDQRRIIALLNGGRLNRVAVFLNGPLRHIRAGCDELVHALEGAEENGERQSAV
jgi:hypothetical protein